LDSSTPARTFIDVNQQHAELCTSPEWESYLHSEVLPHFSALNLGQNMLEIGPGPGAATEWLRSRVAHLTVVEIDRDAAERLRERFAGTNVEVVTHDATELEFEDGSFDAVGCFTMLHHVPTALQQNLILAEGFRVLREGGHFMGSDSLASVGLHHFHVDDTYNPVEPATLLARLQMLGFDQINVDVADVLRFIAHKQDAPSPCPTGSDDGASC
jgi:ubiquinone/menaquinone biosynthesis C-methylase UbiE